MDQSEPATAASGDEIKEVYYLENVEQLQAMSDPMRYSMLIMMTSEARTGAQLARMLNVSRARAHYHLKQLEKAGLVKFCGDAIVSGITEKYYRAVGRMFDFTKLIPEGVKDSQPNEVTMSFFKAMGDFLLTLLDVSRESIVQSGGQANLATGFYYDFCSILTPAQFAEFKKELNGIKDRIIASTHENEQRLASGFSEATVPFRTTLFLTQLPEKKSS